MKIGRKGEVKLARNDVRVGNFVYTLEDGHIKVSDIGGMCTHRVSRFILKGQLLEMALSDYKGGDESRGDFLKGYASVMMNVLCALPITSRSGFSFLAEMNALAERSIAEFPEVYGLKSDIGKEEDEGILEDMKGVREDIDMLKDKLEKR